MKRQDDQVRKKWNQRDTEDNAVTSLAAQDILEQTRHVDIVVAGVGGGGMNAVDRMIYAGVRGVRFIAMNTDAQILALSQAPDRICLGEYYTKGLGAGGNAAVGTHGATESISAIEAVLSSPDLVFIAAGMGGGTGTGAAPIIASIAKKLGALTVGIVTLPFTFEGTQRKRVAEAGVAALRDEIDALITIPNDRLLAAAGRERNLSEAFMLADDVLRQGVQGIAEVINVPGMINVDFADVRSVLREAGTALMSIGHGEGRNRAQLAAEEAIAGGFLNVTISGAQRVLFNISGGEDLSLFEVNEVAERIGAAIDATADITFGAVIDPTLNDTLRVTLIATGMEGIHTEQPSTAVRRDQTQPTPVLPVRTSTSLASSIPNVPATTKLPSVRPASYHPQPSQPPLQPPRQTLPSSESSPPSAFSQNFAGRQRRSLDDLRGIRSMGRRQEALKGKQTEEREEVLETEGRDIPHFRKK